MSTPPSPIDPWEVRLAVARLVGRLRRLSFYLANNGPIDQDLPAFLEALRERLDYVTKFLDTEPATASEETHPSSQS